MNTLCPVEPSEYQEMFFARLAELAFGEWNSAEDEVAFLSLQTLISQAIERPTSFSPQVR